MNWIEKYKWHRKVLKATSMRTMRDWKVSLRCYAVLHTHQTKSNNNKNNKYLNKWKKTAKEVEEEAENIHIKRLNAFELRASRPVRIRACNQWGAKSDWKVTRWQSAAILHFCLATSKTVRIDWSARAVSKWVIMLGKCVSGQGSNDDISTIYENLAQVRAIFLQICMGSN